MLLMVDWWVISSKYSINCSPSFKTHIPSQHPSSPSFSLPLPTFYTTPHHTTPNLNRLQILDKQQLQSHVSNRRYLLDKTQHLIGGFGKKEGDPPDIYHAYLGLAALSLMDELGLKPIDATACFSLDAWKWIEGLPWNVGNGGGREDKRLKLDENSYVGMSGG
jgi:hypothetical protein